MKKTSLLSALVAFGVLGASLSTAVHAQKAGDGGGNGGGSTAGSGPSGGGSTAGSGPSGGGSSGNSNFDNASVWIVAPPQDCQHNPRYCKPKPPVKIVPVVAEIPASKCQLERMIQIATDTYGEPIFRRVRDCDRRYVR